MGRVVVIASALAIASLGAGCKSTDEDNGQSSLSELMAQVDCATGPVPTYNEVAIFTKCAACHSSQLMGPARREAPPDINFDSFDGADAHATKAATEAYEGAMPPAGSGITVTEEEKQQLYRWSLCGSMPTP